MSVSLVIPLWPHQALAQARKYLRASNQDIAVVIASGRKAEPIPQAAEGAAEAAAAAAGAGTSSRYPPTCHRLIVLECQINMPRALLVGAGRQGQYDCVRQVAVQGCLQGRIELAQPLAAGSQHGAL